MKLRWTELIVVQTLMCWLCLNAAAQFSITRPKPASIQQVSATSKQETPNDSVVSARLDASRQAQIRVTVQYLMVDAEARKAIYQRLGPDLIENSSHVPAVSEPSAEARDPLAVSAALRVESMHRFRAPSRVTTCIVDDSEKASIVEIAAASKLCNVSNAPNVILLDGKEAEMNDVVQHPFVVDIQSEAKVVSPTVRVFDEGIRLRLLATLGGSVDAAQDPVETITMSCEVNTSRILDLQTDRIYGVEEEPVTVQVPIHQVTVSQVSRKLAKGQTLMIDPHFAKTKTVQSEARVPVLSNLPYVGRSFRNVSVGDVEQHMIVLLRPSIVKN